LSHEGAGTLTGGFVELRLAENPGSFLSVGALLPDAARLAVFIVGLGIGLIVLASYLIRHTRMGTTRLIGLSLAMGGGMGNLIDRVLRHGLVTDFAVLHIGPIHTGVFNIADIAIMAGIGMVMYTFRRRPRPDGPTRRCTA
jgi:signal peptidase II